jgi:putative transposase
LARWSFSAEQQVLRRLDTTFKAFFARGHPRFRASARFHAAEFRVGDGLTLRKFGKIGFVGVLGEIKVRWHRELPSKPKSAILTRQGGKWYIVFHVEVASVERARPIASALTLGCRT